MCYVILDTFSSFTTWPDLSDVTPIEASYGRSAKHIYHGLHHFSGTGEKY
jgi:hypothetical protein